MFQLLLVLGSSWFRMVLQDRLDLQVRLVLLAPLALLVLKVLRVRLEKVEERLIGISGLTLRLTSRTTW